MCICKGRTKFTIVLTKMLVKKTLVSKAFPIATRPTMIMHHPLSSTHHKGMVLCYLQIIHHLGPRHHFPPCHHAHTPICSQDVHAQLDLAHWQKSRAPGEERMLLVGVDDFTRPQSLAMRPLDGGGERQINQIVIRMDPHVQDGL